MDMVRFRAILGIGRRGAAGLAASLFCTGAALHWGWVPLGSCDGHTLSTVIGFALAITIEPEL